MAKENETLDQLSGIQVELEPTISADGKLLTKAKNAEEVPTGIIMYTDGGCRPNPGYGGWGIHGFMFHRKAPKKPSGNSDHLLTFRGYTLKSDAGLGIGKTGDENRKKSGIEEVTPIHYINGYGSFNYDISNNVAEIVAMTEAFRHAAQSDISSLLVFTDSEYVRKGLDSWVHQWQQNGWLKQDMTAPANVEYWKALVATRDVLIERGVDVRVEWIKAHNDSLGNEIADKLATLGVMTSRTRTLVNTVSIQEAEGYWKYVPERHPFIGARRMYFNTQGVYNTPGQYYLGEHGKDDELLGKRLSDGAFCVVRLKKPEEVLEMLRKHQIRMSGNIDTLIMVRLDALYRPETHRDLVEYREVAMIKEDPYRLDLICLDKQPLTRELRPVKIAMRAVVALSELEQRLDQYLAKDERITVTVLTPILYETLIKSSKKSEVRETKLKPEFNVGYAALKVDAKYKAADGSSKSADVILTLGIDLLDRNALKRLEASAPKVSFISWQETEQMFRYATVVESGEDVGIWAGVYSNTRVVS